MKAIQTTYLGFTDTLPDRIVVRCYGLPLITYVVKDLQEKLPILYNRIHHTKIHVFAAQEYCKVQSWPTNLVSGCLRGNTYVHCFAKNN